MSVYQYLDPTADQAEALFWELVPVVAEQAGITEADALHHMRRVWVDRLKDIKPHHAVDHTGDGRSALWRVRLSIWEGDKCVADTDTPRAFEEDGATVLAGLPAVAAWVREMVALAHPGATLSGLEEGELSRKLKSLRVALSNSGGSSIWRLRYAVEAPAAPEPAAPAQPGRGVNLLKAARSREPTLRHCLAHVRVTREESPRHRI